MKRTGLLLAGITVLIAACGPRTADVSIDDVDLPTTAVAEAANGDVISDSLPVETDIRVPRSDEGEAVTEGQSGSPTTTVPTVTRESSAVTTTTTTAPAEIALPDLSELDQLLADVESLVDDIDLTQTEGDLP